MQFKWTGLASFFILILLLSACGGNESTPASKNDTTAAEEKNTSNVSWSPTNVAEGIIKSDPVDIGPGSSIEIRTPTPTPAGTVEPVYGSVVIKNASVSLPNGSATPVVRVIGYLPSPCHKLIIKMDPDIGQKIISIHVLSSAYLQVPCNQKYMPFDQTIRLVDIPRGKYTVWINGNNLSTVSIP